MKKNIWYLHHYAGAPGIGMSYRPYFISYHLKHLGFNPSIIAASFHHLLTRCSHQIDTVKQELIEDIPYIWLKTNSYHGNRFGRLRNMFTYTWRLKTQYKKIVSSCGKPDIIIVSSSHPFHYLIASKIAKKYDAKLIFEVRDVWPLTLIELLDLNPKHPLLMLMSYIERRAYKEADYVVSLLPNAFEYMHKFALTKDRFIYIPNGITIQENNEESLLPSELQQKIIQLRKKNKFIIVYTGAHGIPNALDQLIEALTLLNDNTDIHAILVGKGNEKENLQLKAKHLSNVSFFDPIDKLAIPTLLKQCDACFIGWQNKNLYQYGISANKIFDYMLAAKPIIQAVNTKNDPVALADCGLITSPENPPQLVKAILKMIAMEKSTLQEMGERGREYVKQYHDYQILAEKYVELFN